MKQKASFTIEATIWVSLILCMVVGVLQKGIDFLKVCDRIYTSF